MPVSICPVFHSITSQHRSFLIPSPPSHNTCFTIALSNPSPPLSHHLLPASNTNPQHPPPSLPPLNSHPTPPSNSPRPTQPPQSHPPTTPSSQTDPATRSDPTPPLLRHRAPDGRARGPNGLLCCRRHVRFSPLKKKKELRQMKKRRRKRDGYAPLADRAVALYCGR